ncbi:MAG: prolyl oligopeptidase family serine peptidase, partial [Muribaculaceae bacterium]|nr:prolyl oligopeptidase family serine peptidase [Muribaculaceae bacterium]
IFGWSYGGYQALMAATQPGNPFKATVSIAPVTDWRLYDTVYTERYMSTPQQNEDGYDSSSALTRTSDLSGKLLIMHGTADDNVHIANSMEFISRLIADGKYCDFFVFPNMNHSINYCNGRQLIYTRMLEWFNANL